MLLAIISKIIGIRFIANNKKLNKTLEEGFKNTETPKMDGGNEEEISQIYK